MTGVHARGRGEGWSTALYVGILGVVLWSPLPFGSIEPWAVGLLRIAACALVAVWAVWCARRGALVVSSSAIQLPLYLAAGYALLQWVTSISLDPFSSRQSAVTLLAMAVLLSIALVALDGRRRLERAATALFWTGFGLSVLGILQYLSGTRDIYWLRESPVVNFFGPFVNKNHFAGLMELALPMGLGLLVTGAVPRERRPLMLFAALVISVAVALSRSRAGLLCLALEIFALGWAAVASSEARVPAIVRTAVLGAVLVGGAAAGVFWLGSEPLTRGFADLPAEAAGQEATGRQAIWRSTLALIGEHPVLGAGIGAYGTAIVAHWPATERVQLNYAHNDYLQVVADAGIVGAVLVILFAIVLTHSLIRGLRHTDTVLKGVALGAGIGVIGLAIHSIVDFNLQIPSNALTYLFASAMVVRSAAAAEPERQGGVL